MEDKFFTIVIPVIPKHFRYLHKLLIELNVESRLIKEVLLCASSVTGSTEKDLQDIIQKSPPSLRVRALSNTDKRTAGENRNLGWDHADAEFVAFLDADDIYHPSRLSTILAILLENNADALVHNYYKMVPKRIFKHSKLMNFDIVCSEDLLEANAGRLKQQLPSDVLYSGQTNLLLPTTMKNHPRVHHGHLVVRQELPVRYSSRQVGEDGELVVEIIRNGLKLIYADCKLSIYDRLNFTNIKESIVGRIKVTLSRIYRYLLSKFLRK